MTPKALSTIMAEYSSPPRRSRGSRAALKPLIFSLHQWAKAEGCPRAFQPWEADELSPRFMAVALDNCGGRQDQGMRSRTGKIYQAGLGLSA
jgi:hypothetical protein